MAEKMQDSSQVLDVLIVGAGLSGINAAYRLNTQLPDASYTILESRDTMGGTWGFFKYPGIRSDSDLHTFGFPWRPWSEAKAIADGPSILQYIKECAAVEGIDTKIQYQHKVTHGDWSSETQTWKLTVDANGTKKTYNARYIILGTGYYDYEEAMPASIPGLDRFKGQTIHPQFWPEDLDYANKKMIIIGSGATAITLLPNLAEKAAKVTMLQRSPSYIINMPQAKDNTFLRRVLPRWMLFKLTRLQFLIFPFLFFKFCRAFPNAAKKTMMKRTLAELPPNVPLDPHFNPSYNPWEQRLCLSPDGDFFQCLRKGKADIATGHIETVTEDGITLKDGTHLTGDIIITATGLKIQMAGGTRYSVDGVPLNVGDKFIWKGIMLQDMPNAAFVVGYTNASWTLGADATAQHVIRILKHMRASGQGEVVARMADGENVEPKPLLNLNSTYIKKATGLLPMAGDKAPWKPRSNYFSDIIEAWYGNITKGLQYYRATTL